MPRKALGGVPFPPLQVIDTDLPVLAQQFVDMLTAHPQGISLCVRAANGHASRGGYFFHFRRAVNGNQVELVNFETRVVTELTEDELADLINHCTGLAFSESALALCQDTINFRLDPE